MSKELNEMNKKAIDALFENGFNRTKAYMSVYKQSNKAHARTSMYQILRKPKAKEYYDLKYKEFRELLDVDKHQMLDKLTAQVDMFDTMIELASKDNLTALEEEKLDRLKDLVKGADVMKAKDMICKIIGAYEPEKIEVTEKTYSVGFDTGNFDDAEEVN